ncbi:hypothetical protein [Streptomyces sp. Ru71]|nr:hypothetical protein [Streptomyces sp. Ru71]
MKLGKALATGVAEEEPQSIRAEEPEPAQEITDVEVSLPEEVPAAR